VDVDGRQKQFNDQSEHVRSVRAFPDKEEVDGQAEVQIADDGSGRPIRTSWFPVVELLADSLTLPAHINPR
jgi:hypothetical protein